MKRYMISQFLQSKRKAENKICSSSRRCKNFRSRQRRRKFNKSAGAGEIDMESTNFQILNSGEVEADSLSLNSNGIGDTKNEEDNDFQFQQILFYSAQFHSGKNLESSSNHAPGKQVVETEYSVIHGSISKVNSVHEMGESSCSCCEICEDAFPPNTLIQGSSCRHYYCEECIKNYIVEKINEDIHKVNCPVSGCKRILDLESLMPNDFLVRVRDAIRETKVLASPYVIYCPFWDCTGKLIDDRKRFLIRACPKCWRIFCCRCRDAWHLGMTCDAYQWQLNFFNRQIQEYGDDDDEEEDTGKGNSMITNF